MVPQDTRVKKWRPKTRTGCRTCRARRVKCDETRPVCNKCSNSSRVCGGYEVAAARVGGQQTLLLPRAETLPHSPDQISSDHQLNLLPWKLQTEELRAFQCFRAKVHILAIHFSGAVWTEQVLRRSHHEPTILNGIIALGAMFQFRHELAAAPRGIYRITSGEHHSKQVALKHYSQALTCLRHAIEEGGSDTSENVTTITLVACLLFVCFEMLQGDQLKALTHMLRGLQILGEHCIGPQSPKGDLAERLEKRQSQKALQDLSNVFSRLDAECAMSGPGAPYLQLANDCISLSPRTHVPSTFTTVDDAKECLDILNVQTLTFRSTLLRIVGQQYPETFKARNFLSFCVLSTRARRIDLEDHPSLTEKRAELLKSYERWLATARSIKAGAHWPTVALMEIQSFFPWFMLLTSFDRTECLCDVNQDKFQHVLDLATRFSRGANRKAGTYGFALDAGMLASLYLVGIKCRDSDTRSSVISVLEGSKIQEGFWNGVILAKYVRSVKEIEEQKARDLRGTLTSDEKLKATDIPEEARFSDVSFTTEDDFARLVCVRYANDSTEELEIQEERFPVV